MNIRAKLLGGVALLALTGAAGAADMAPSYKAPAPVPYARSDWSGFYVGLEAGYGWGSRSFDTNLDGANVFGNSDFANLTNRRGNGIFNNPFVMPDSTLTNKGGWLAGGFFGGQRQYGSWVFGIEADVNATDISNSFRASGTRNERVTALDVVNPITSVGGIGATGTGVIPETELLIPGQTINLSGVPTVRTLIDGQPVQVIQVPGTVIPEGTAITIRITVGDSSQNLQIVVPAGGLTVPPSGIVTFPVNGLGTPDQKVTVNGQTIPVTTVTNPDQFRRLLLPNGEPAFVPVLAQGLAAVTRTVAIDTKIDMLSSVRGRVGFTPWDNVLIYGTGGLALAHASATSTITQNTAAFEVMGLGTIGATTNTSRSSASGTMLGWALGAGLDFKVMPNVFVGVEYLHYDFPKNAFAFTDGRGAGFSLNNDHMRVDAVKARVGFLFN